MLPLQLWAIKIIDVNGISPVSYTHLVILILNSKNKVTIRILSMAFVQFAFYVGTFISQIKKGNTLFSKVYWKYALQFNIPLLPHYLSLTVLSSSDRIMISSMVGADKAGIYNLAYAVSMIMTMFNTCLLYTSRCV